MCWRGVLEGVSVCVLEGYVGCTLTEGLLVRGCVSGCVMGSIRGRVLQGSVL